jgi:hypothetical protein
MGPSSRPNSSVVTNFKPFLVWLAIFYCVWLAVVWLERSLLSTTEN